MSAFSMQVMDSLLTHQGSLGVTGHLLEFGVYKGRSASLVSAHVREQERFILADIRQLLTEEVLGKLYATGALDRGHPNATSPRTGHRKPRPTAVLQAPDRLQPARKPR